MGHFGHFQHAHTVSCDRLHARAMASARLVCRCQMWLHMRGQSTYCLPHRPLVGGCLVSTSWLLCLMLWRALTYNFLSRRMSPCLLGMYLETELLVRLSLFQLLRKFQTVFQSGDSIFVPAAAVSGGGSDFSPVLVTPHCFGDTHPRGYEVVSHCGWVVFPNWLVVSSIFLWTDWSFLLWVNVQITWPFLNSRRFFYLIEL